EPIVFERVTEDLPPKTVEIKPHPYGIELGTFLAMAKETKSYKLSAFLEEEFSRISSRVAREICEKAARPPETKPKSRDLRFSNRVPLLCQAGACEITQAVQTVDWRRYGLEQRGGSGLPFGPAIVLVHVASVKVPYTSEAKEAVAPIPEIMEEIDLALKEC